MTTVFNLNRYDKIVANDLSLNGTISTALGGLSQWEDSGSDIYFNGGNVGIGTTSPAQLLQVKGANSDYPAMRLSNDSANFDIMMTGSSFNDALFTNRANGNIMFETTGNVGIGTTSPDAILEVAAPFNTGTSLYESSSIMLSTTGSGYNVAMGSIVGYHKAAADNSSSSWPGGLLFRYKPQNGSTNKVLNDGMVLNGLGNVGIGTTNPTRKLHMHDSGTCYLKLTSGSITGGLQFATVTSGDAFILQYEDRPIRISVGTYGEVMRIKEIDGFVGIGTTSPAAPLHVEGYASTGVEGNKGAYFRWATNVTGGNPSHGGHLTYNTSNTTMNVGIRSYQSIATNAYIISFSDMRLKKDIVELTDDSSLQKIRLLKPSSYKYKDPITKNEFNTVDGFIAQEVKEIMPHATGIITDIIPNIMILGTSIIDGSNNYILTIPDFDTSTLEMDASNNLYPKLKIFLDKDEKRIINIKEIISATQLKVETDESLPEEIFIYGQEVDNVHTIIKDKIFTTGISALQEVDRQQQADKAKIASLETQLADVLQRLSNANI